MPGRLRYGDSQGRPSEKALKADALKIYDDILARHNVAPEKVIVMGRSLGTGVATYVASQRQVAGVVLVTGYDSLVAVAASHYPFLPVRWLLHHRFESATLASEIPAPLLNLVAGQDRVVPAEHGYQLAQQWHGKVQTLSFQRANHLNITDEKGYWSAIQEFIQQHTQ
ncbi:MAG: alpha/beta hydrolase [Motiliproteus sp.]|nr:alpha/beta hydrolase [Motiliproteus sp.]MCW9050716.1 alpha/beta hydrolase [Motiliproteus sp.]